MARPRLAVPDAVSPAPTLDVSPAAERNTVAVGGVPAEPDRSEVVTVALAPSEASPGPDAAGLRQYRLALAGEARRFRHYPEAARRAGVAGTVEVRVMVRGSAPPQTELVHSSGRALLDAAALEMLRVAAARTPLPDSLRGIEFAVLLPVVFSMED